LCDENGNGLKGVADLEKVKRSGRAYLEVSGGKWVPWHNALLSIDE
jgi:hypothetical protein